MHHLAILSKKWKLLDLILEGKKTIESRWYKFKRDPWDRIKKKDIIFFKNSGEPVTAKAEVSRVLQFDLRNTSARTILDKYGKQICIKSSKGLENKNYCILIFLKNPQKITPFNINKKGFGLMAAWISVININKIRKL